MTAHISDCGLYRYNLGRQLTGSGPVALFLMCNPSTADAEQDDPTIRRCLGFARAIDARAVRVVNLWAYRATAPSALAAAFKAGDDIVGPDNDAAIRTAAQDALTRAGEVDSPTIVLAWGAAASAVPRAQDRIDAVLRHLVQVTTAPWLCLGRTAAGAPRHPLMVPSSKRLELWRSDERGTFYHSSCAAVRGAKGATS